MIEPQQQIHQEIQAHLEFLYGPKATGAAQRLEDILARFAAEHPHFPKERARFSEEDAVLITYGDQIRAEGESTLRTLYRFLNDKLAGVIGGVHILPFYPYTSDDGFSVVDYFSIDPALGNWDDVRQIGEDFKLMVDAVVNHVSASSAWFQGFLQDHPKYRDYFIVADPGADYSAVFRPRTLPLLTPFQTPSGIKHVWTTFSADQIDLNFHNPEVLLEVIESLLLYVHYGAQLIRLDAVGFIWKEAGTSCMHLEGAHRIVKLMRLVLDLVAPQVTLVTETNVPHRENISYYGNGTDEAQMVYQFPLPPLVLHTFRTGDASALAAWVKGLEAPNQGNCFFNFLASHDGMGVIPATGLIPPKDIAALVEQCLEHGGQVNYKNTPVGPVPYELCITLFDMLNNPYASEDEHLQIARFLAAQTILLSLAGVPGIYIHSLFGSPSDQDGLAESGINRRLNRHKFTADELYGMLENEDSRASQILERLGWLLEGRSAHPAFSPSSPQQILNTSSGLFALVRGSKENGGRVACFVNVTGDFLDLQEHHLDSLTMADLNLLGKSGRWLIYESFARPGPFWRLMPYGVAWVELDVPDIEPGVGE